MMCVHRISIKKVNDVKRLEWLAERRMESGTLDEDFGAEDFEWIQQETERVVISRALAREVLRRRNCMRIIQLLVKAKTSLRQKEILSKLNLNWKLGQHNLNQLVKCGLVKNVHVEVLDKQSRYYELADDELGAKLAQSFHRLVGLRLVKTFEFQKTYLLSDLQKDVQFLTLCKKYDLSFDEAVECLEQNARKLEPLLNYDKHIIGFKRK